MNPLSVLNSLRGFLTEARPKKKKAADATPGATDLTGPKAQPKPVRKRKPSPPAWRAPVPDDVRYGKDDDAVPEISPELLKVIGSPKSFVLSLNPRGRSRFDQLKNDVDTVYAHDTYCGTDFIIEYTGGDDFAYKANRQYLLENYPFLYSVGDSAGFDVSGVISLKYARRPYDVSFEEGNELMCAELDKIEEDVWQEFIETIEGLRSYPVLDEQLMSELESKADEEFVESDGLRDLQRALEKQANMQDSFLQFVVGRLTGSDVWSYLRILEHWDFDHSEGSSYMNMGEVARKIDPDMLLGKEDGWDAGEAGEREAKVKILRKGFDRMKMIVFRQRLADPLRDALSRILSAHRDEATAEYLTYLHRATEAQLYAMVNHVVPESAFADDDMPAWREHVVKEEDGSPRSIWTITAPDLARQRYDTEEAGIQAVAELLAPQFGLWYRQVTGDDPRQLKLKLEDAEAIRRVLQEASDFDIKASVLSAAGVRTVFKDGQGNAIIAVSNAAALRRELPPGFTVDGYMEFTERYFDHTTSRRSVLVIHQPIARIPCCVLSVPMDIEDGLDCEMYAAYPTGGQPPRILCGDAMRQILISPITLALPKALGDVLIEDRSDTKGAEACVAAQLQLTDNVSHFPDAVVKATSGTRSAFLRTVVGVHFGVAGNRRRAASRLNSENTKADATGVWVFVPDWTALADVFEKRQQDTASKVFDNDIWDWFDSDQLPDHREACAYLSDKAQTDVLAAMAGTTYVNDDGEEVVFDPADMQESLQELLGRPEFSEVWEAVRMAVDSASRWARERRVFEVYSKAACDVLGVDRHQFFDHPGKPGSDRLGLHVPWRAIRLSLVLFSGDSSQSFTTLSELLLRPSEPASVNEREDFWASIDPDDVYANLDLPKAAGQSPVVKTPPVPDAEVPEPPTQESLRVIDERLFAKSCLLISLPPEHADAVQAWARGAIPEDRLFVSDDAHGFEDEPHITVKWGLFESEPSEELLRIVQGTKPFVVRMGTVSLFRNEEFDVVKLGVESPELTALHRAIKAAVPNTETHPTYQPHVTLAYVRKGSCDDLEGSTVFNDDDPPGPAFTVEEIEFKGAGDSDDPESRVVQSLPLDKRGETVDLSAVDEGFVPDPFEHLPFPADQDRLALLRRKRKAARRLL